MIARVTTLESVALGNNSRPVVDSGVAELGETPTCEVDGMMDMESFVFKDGGIVKEEEEEMREEVTKEVRDKDDEGEREE